MSSQENKPFEIESLEVQVNQSDASLFQIYANHQFSPNHSLMFNIIRTSLKPNSSNISSKVLPVIVHMIEEKGNDKYIDIYTFDHKGTLLNHGYSEYKDGQCVVDEEHDLSIDRLVEQGEAISDILKLLGLPVGLGSCMPVLDLRENKVDAPGYVMKKKE
ncbi:hypothetical protein GOV04_00455 [Candidatus Woesearchaeota archaeon]|nr:hypothetical protein [Candidatus Woesearchaeota archaeon]